MKTIKYDQFIKKLIFQSILFTLLLLGGIAFVAQKYMLDTIKQESNELGAMIFNTLYLGMQGGANHNEIEAIIANINAIHANTYVDVHRGPLVDELFGKYKTPVISFDNPRDELYIKDGSTFTYTKVVHFKNECLACHTNAKSGDVAGIIETNTSLFDSKLSVSFMLFYIPLAVLISIATIVVILFFYLRNQFLRPLDDMIEEMENITTHNDLAKQIRVNSNLYEIVKIETTFNQLFSKLSSSYNNLKETSQRDDLTNLFNRNKLYELVENRFGQNSILHPVAVVLLDLNKFKPINDTFGHQVGDEVLQVFARALLSNIKGSDYAFRTGGDEFVLLLPNTTKKDATIVLEHIRRYLLGHKNYDITIEFSAGIAVCPDDGGSYDELIKIADEQMYEDKNARGEAR